MGLNIQMSARYMFCSFLLLPVLLVFSPWRHTWLTNMSTDTATMQSRIVGHWQLRDHYAFLSNDEENHEYPLGSDPKGFIIFTQDGYMSTHMVTSEIGKPSALADHSPSYTNPAFVGSQSTSYAGQYNIDTTEKGSTVSVHVHFASLPAMIGTVQQREVRFDEDANGTTLSLNILQPMKYIGEDRFVRVRWRRVVDT